MKGQVKVAVHPDTKKVITQNPNKPEFGTIRLDQEVVTMEGGFLNRTKRSGFISGKMTDLEAMGYKEGQIIAGTIRRVESFEPQFEGQNHKINPETKADVLVDGKKVYFQDKFTEDVEAKDVLVKTQAEVVNSTPAIAGSRNTL